MKIKLALILALALALGWFFYPRKQKPLPIAKSAAQLAESPEIRHLYRDPRKTIPLTAQKNEETDCGDFLKSLRSQDLSGLFSKTSMKKPFEHQHPPKCDHLPAKFAQVHKRYLEICGKYAEIDREKVPAHFWENVKSACLLTTALYRAVITDWMTQDIPLEQISDPQILADKAVAQYTEDPGRGAQVADRLMEVEPNYVAAQISAFGHFLDARENAGGNIDDPRWEQTKRSIDRAEEMGPHDQNRYLEMAMAIELSTTNDPNELGKKAEWINTNRPNSPTGEYILAHLALVDKDRASALEHLANAARIDKADPKYQAGYDVLSQAKPEDNPQVIQASFPLPLESLVPKQ